MVIISVIRFKGIVSKFKNELVLHHKTAKFNYFLYFNLVPGIVHKWTQIIDFAKIIFVQNQLLFKNNIQFMIWYLDLQDSKKVSL